MLQRALIRSARPIGRPIGRFARRRPYSTEKIELQGVEDNAFNRERLAVKQHAAETSGMYLH
jgi:cytochrome c oxidase subunit 6a